MALRRLFCLQPASTVQQHHRLFKKSAGKAAASEEARREVHTALRVGRSPLTRALGERKYHSATPTFGPAIPKVEPLSEARTPLTGFFNSLLDLPPETPLHFHTLKRRDRYGRNE